MQTGFNSLKSGLGYDVSCPGHESNTATIPVVEPVSEYRMSKKIGMSLAKDNVEVKYMAADGDALRSHGIQDGKHAVAIQRLPDPAPHGGTQFRHITKRTFSPRMFPGDVAILRAENKKMLEEDVKRHRLKTLHRHIHPLFRIFRCLHTKDAANHTRPTGLLYARSTLDPMYDEGCPVSTPRRRQKQLRSTP